MKNSNYNPAGASKGRIWTGRIISILCVLFLVFDAAGKIFRESHSVNGTMMMGFDVSFVPVLGTILAVCVIIHLIPRTAVLGAVLITAYLGGAVASMMRIGVPYYFPVALGILFWIGFYLRDSRVKQLL